MAQSQPQTPIQPQPQQQGGTSSTGQQQQASLPPPALGQPVFRDWASI